MSSLCSSLPVLLANLTESLSISSNFVMDFLYCFPVFKFVDFHSLSFPSFCLLWIHFVRLLIDKFNLFNRYIGLFWLFHLCWVVVLRYWDLSSFLMYKCYKYPTQHLFSGCIPQFGLLYFHSFPSIFKISIGTSFLNHRFRNVLLNCQVFGNLLLLFLLLISSWIHLWSENILCVISVLG